MKKELINVAKRLIVIIGSCLFFYMVGTLIWISSYSVLVADDFSHGLTVGTFNEPMFPYLLTSFKFVKKLYFDWSGMYFSMFMQALLSPINHYGFIQLRVVMACNALLFFFL